MSLFLLTLLSKYSLILSSSAHTLSYSLMISSVVGNVNVLDQSGHKVCVGNVDDTLGFLIWNSSVIVSLFGCESGSSKLQWWTMSSRCMISLIASSIWPWRR
jgi:hypothetical protein